MKKIILGASLIFISHISMAETIITANNDLLIEAGSHSTDIAGTEGCRLIYGYSSEPRIIKQNSSFALIDSSVKNPLLQSIASKVLAQLGANTKANIADCTSVERLRLVVRSNGGELNSSAEDLITQSGFLHEIAREAISSIGGEQHDVTKIKTYADFKSQLLELGGVINISAEELINQYRQGTLILESKKTNKKYKISCHLDNVGALEMLSRSVDFNVTKNPDEL